MAKSVAKLEKVVYPPGCKELSEDLGKDELVKRLKLLARAFQDMGQDDNEQYSGLAVMLASDQYMEHSSKDVRLLVACCIADVFRIFAPEAPYKEQEQLKEIFMFLIQQLRGLQDPDSPSFKRYFYLLENLSWVKSFNICIELDDNQEIFCALFKLMFSIVNENHSGKVRTFMLDMMTPLICEADAVSQELLDVILVQLVEPRKIQNKIAYGMAKDLVKRTSHAIEPYIQAFFNNLLMLGKTSESEVSSHLYDLIFELNQVAPNVLFAVLPQLEFKLKSSEESERKSVTKLLAKMFSEHNSDLALKNKPLWNCFLGRFNDICIQVRTVCVQFAQLFILNHPELVKDILEQLKVRQHDPEETVRMEVVNCMLQVARKDFSACTDEMLHFIRERTLDKKFKIRREAVLGLGNIYKSVMSRDPVDPQQAARVDWIRNKVFHHYYQNSNDDRLLVERILNIHLVPYTLPMTQRMSKLLELYCSLDENAVKAFSEMVKHRSNVRQIVQQLLDAHDQQNQPNPPPIYPKLVSLARTLPEQQRPNELIKKLNLSLKDDLRMRQLLRTLVAPDCTCKKAEDTVKEVLRKVGGRPGQNQLYYTLVKSLLERIAPVMLDSCAVQALVGMVKQLLQGHSPLANLVDNPAPRAIRLLLTLSHAYPHYFNTAEVYEDFLTFLKHEDDVVCDCTLQILADTGTALEDNHPHIYTVLIPILTGLAKMGTPKQTKHALRCINVICRNKQPVLAQVFEHVQKSLHPDSANYITAIVALGHLAFLCPEAFAADMRNIVTKVVVKELLMQDRTSGPETEEPWYADHLVTEETQAKVQAMKLLVRWLLGLKSNVNNSATSTLRLLYTVIIHEGDLMEHHCLNKPELARLRLQAGCCMMKLAEESCYCDIITREQFQALALLINDSCYYVRLHFALKLHKGLVSLRLPLEYLSIFCLAANDPLKERRTQLKAFLSTNISKRRDYLKQNPNARGLMTSVLPDYLVPSTIHLLAHDPDFKSHDHVDSLKNLKECLWFVLEPLMGRTEDYNYAFLRRMVEKIKQTRDAQCPDDPIANKKLYAVCDLALGLMNIKSTNITLKDSNVEPPLPSKLFTPADKTYSNMQSYLPKDFQFDPKRRFQPCIAGSKVQTTTEIIVMSHAPIVNPMPRSPRVPKKSPRQKAKQPAQQPDSEAESEQSDVSLSPAQEDGGGSQESPDLEPGPVKVGTRQTKLEEFGAGGRRGREGRVLNGSNKPSTRRAAKAGGEGGHHPQQTSRKRAASGDDNAGGQAPQDPPQTSRKQAASEDDKVGGQVPQDPPQTSRKRAASGDDKAGGHPPQDLPQTSRKRAASGDDKVGGQAPQDPPKTSRKRAASGDDSTAAAAAKRVKGVVAVETRKTGGRKQQAEKTEESESADSQQSTRGSSRRRHKSKSPSPQPSVPAKRGRATRAELRGEGETPPAPTSREVSKAVTRRAPPSNTSTHRGRCVSNGTSDGEEHSTQESDSQSSSKQQALTRALELRPAATPPDTHTQQEELKSRRRTTRPRNK